MQCVDEWLVELQYWFVICVDDEVVCFVCWLQVGDCCDECGGVFEFVVVFVVGIDEVCIVEVVYGFCMIFFVV